jgi:hypothetical protein
LPCREAGHLKLNKMKVQITMVAYALESEKVFQFDAEYIVYETQMAGTAGWTRIAFTDEQWETPCVQEFAVYLQKEYVESKQLYVEQKKIRTLLAFAQEPTIWEKLKKIF